MPREYNGWRSREWWLWLVAVILLYIVAALGGCDLLGGHS